MLLADLWGDAMYAKSERSTTSVALTVPVPVQAGPTVSPAHVDVAAVAKDLEDAGSDSDSTAVSSASSEPGEPPASAGIAPAAPAETASSDSVSAEFTPRSQPVTGAGGKRARRTRASVQAPGVDTTSAADTNAPRVKRRFVGLGRSLLVRRHHAASAAVGLGSARTKRPSPKRRHPYGLSGGPPAKRLRIPTVSGRAKA